MKKYILLIICVLGAVVETFAQWVNIPDTAFGMWLNSNGYSQCLQGNNTLGWQMDTSCQAVTGTTSIYCQNKGIKNIEGVQYFDSLQILDCTLNQITYLPPLQDSLLRLHCTNNQITSLPSLPNNLIELICGGNQLDSLPTLPGSLLWLSCPNAHLNYLPTLPSNLRVLYCSDNEFTYLPTLPTTLKVLWCGGNRLSTLPSLPNNIEELSFHNNLFSVSPIFPNSLLRIYCYDNQLVSLSDLPDSLQILSCSNNQINSLPFLPGSLLVLNCKNNQLSNIPSLPDSLYSLDCRNNPNLHCLPLLTKIWNLRFDSANVVCLQNYGQVNSSSPSIAQIPLCDLTNDLYNCSDFNSTSSNAPEDKYLLWPNPTSNQLFIETNGLPIYEVSIYNYNGVLVSRTMGPQINYISVNQLSEGIYVAAIKTQTQVFLHKWVKM